MFIPDLSFVLFVVLVSAESRRGEGYRAYGVTVLEVMPCEMRTPLNNSIAPQMSTCAVRVGI